ncbi:MAG: 3-(cis-5,6-dihydroxycyclohexa-1,3-dien-1-yl)propanoate dehydrogenase [Parvibaculaceae bacterium]
MAALDGQVVLITGGGSGLGRGIVERFLEEGARIAVFDHDPAKLASVAQSRPEETITVQGDVRSASDISNAVGKTLERFGKLDCAIGNAGIWDYSTPLDDVDSEKLDAAFDEVFGVNVKGYLHLAKACLPALVRSQGSLVFTVSNAGFDPNGGGVLYTASKHAVVGLIRQLAFEFAPVVRVNGVAPGPIDTDLRGPGALGLADTAISDFDLPAKASPVMPLGLVPTPSQYAGAYVYYASRRDNIPATGGVLSCETGIAVRGISSVNGGTELAEKYGSNGESA